MDYENIHTLLNKINDRIKTQDKALNDGIELGMQMRSQREDIIEQDYLELEKDPRKFLIKKALYYLEYDPDNREKYLNFIRDYFFEFKTNYVNNSDDIKPLKSLSEEVDPAILEPLNRLIEKAEAKLGRPLKYGERISEILLEKQNQ